MLELPHRKRNESIEKGNLYRGQRNRKCLFPVKETHKAINVFIDKQLKDDLVQLCETTGLTQTQMIERWIQSEKARVFNP